MPFQPGQSGNPAGRPLGARNKATVLMEQLVERDGEALIHPFVEQGKMGNTRALAQLMGMILPKRKGAHIELDLLPLENASEAPAAIAAVISAVCRGELPAEEGTMRTRMVEAFLRTKLNAEKLVRKLDRLATKARKAAEPQVARDEEAPLPVPAPAQADPRRPVARMSEATSGAPLPASRSAPARLAPLRQEALSSTSPLATRA